jgi:hypothetical protein
VPGAVPSARLADRAASDRAPPAKPGGHRSDRGWMRYVNSLTVFIQCSQNIFIRQLRRIEPRRPSRRRVAPAAARHGIGSFYIYSLTVFRLSLEVHLSLTIYTKSRLRLLTVLARAHEAHPPGEQHHFKARHGPRGNLVARWVESPRLLAGTSPAGRGSPEIRVGASEYLLIKYIHSY